jgi:hypothetical protein
MAAPDPNSVFDRDERPFTVRFPSVQCPLFPCVEGIRLEAKSTVKLEASDRAASPLDHFSGEARSLSCST